MYDLPVSPKVAHNLFMIISICFPPFPVIFVLDLYQSMVPHLMI